MGSHLNSQQKSIQLATIKGAFYIWLEALNIKCTLETAKKIDYLHCSSSGFPVVGQDPILPSKQLFSSWDWKRAGEQHYIICHAALNITT